MSRYKRVVKEFFSGSIRDFRLRHHYSQEYMAELLHISTRCYIDQEHGKYGFSAVPLLSFLLLLSDNDVLLMLHNFRELLEKEAHNNDAA